MTGPTSRASVMVCERSSPPSVHRAPRLRDAQAVSVVCETISRNSAGGGVSMTVRLGLHRVPRYPSGVSIGTTTRGIAAYGIGRQRPARQQRPSRSGCAKEDGTRRWRYLCATPRGFPCWQSAKRDEQPIPSHRRHLGAAWLLPKGISSTYWIGVGCAKLVYPFRGA
jgi:hypothetical protein